jgi:hypothetical protein
MRSIQRSQRRHSCLGLGFAAAQPPSGNPEEACWVAAQQDAERIVEGVRLDQRAVQIDTEWNSRTKGSGDRLGRRRSRDGFCVSDQRGLSFVFGNEVYAGTALSIILRWNPAGAEKGLRLSFLQVSRKPAAPRKQSAKSDLASTLIETRRNNSPRLTVRGKKRNSKSTVSHYLITTNQDSNPAETRKEPTHGKQDLVLLPGLVARLVRFEFV